MYNRSEIMKKAWEGFKSMRRQGSKTYTFAQALKYAWMMAKKAVENAAKEASKEVSKIKFDGFAVLNGFSFKLWEKEVSTNKTIRRIYINSNGSNKGGYIDITNGIDIFASGSAASAARQFISLYKI